MGQTSDQFSPNYLIKAIFRLRIWSVICIILVLELSPVTALSGCDERNNKNTWIEGIR